ncbi:Fe(3+) ABC transporter substrate-binding protein [Caulobacter sp. 17J80-11]|uniref:Fe(3+) ABC transporter substrate-binding protein n=1 Tax=Caulobacter sp. 17J80-11 TaxID=2763502 RepID=UPI0016536AFF|nr:Fe(3+) ABC transporter substrate-binding protein [Caulobacter sp. 17J80-11]MBC6983471.1 Fe(3+) ABC transporter substrate-binding protein [Caulobacter sp. 17J80-11]
MRQFGKALSTASALVLSFAVLAGCGPRKEAEVPTKGELNLYTARHYDADLELYKAFTKATGIKVNRLEMGPDQLIERMKAEGDASPADVILTSDAGALWRAEQAGLFQPIQSAVLNEKIPAGLRDPQNEWFGFSRRARVIAYDKAKVKPEEVATYEALAEPRFKGKVCVRSSDNVYNLSLMSALIERWGQDKALTWAKGVVANMARPPQGGDIEQIKAIGAGVCDVALTNTYYYLRLVRSGDAGDKATAEKVALSFPNLDGHGTHVNISGGGVARYAPHKDAAVKFLEFLATDEAQEIFAGANNEYPAVASVKPPALVAQYSNFTADPMPVTTYGARQAEAQAVFDKAGWR